MEMSVETAFQRSIETLIDWIDSQVNMNKTQVLFRTFAPVHFRFTTSPICLFILIFSSLFWWSYLLLPPVAYKFMFLLNITV